MNKILQETIVDSEDFETFIPHTFIDIKSSFSVYDLTLISPFININTNILRYSTNKSWILKSTIKAESF